MVSKDFLIFLLVIGPLYLLFLHHSSSNKTQWGLIGLFWAFLSNKLKRRLNFYKIRCEILAEFWPFHVQFLIIFLKWTFLIEFWTCTFDQFCIIFDQFFFEFWTFARSLDQYCSIFWPNTLQIVDHKNFRKKPQINLQDKIGQTSVWSRFIRDHNSVFLPHSAHKAAREILRGGGKRALSSSSFFSFVFCVSEFQGRTLLNNFLIFCSYDRLKLVQGPKWQKRNWKYPITKTSKFLYCHWIWRNLHFKMEINSPNNINVL